MPSRNQINAAAASLLSPLASQDFLDGVEALRHALNAETFEWNNAVTDRATGLLIAAWTLDYARGVIALGVMLGANTDTLLLCAKRIRSVTRQDIFVELPTEVVVTIQ